MRTNADSTKKLKRSFSFRESPKGGSKPLPPPSYKEVKMEPYLSEAILSVAKMVAEKIDGEDVRYTFINSIRIELESDLRG